MDNVSEIKQKLDIVDVVGGYVPLKKAGKNYKGLCPFHSEDTPSFMVSPELQIYKCFGCNEAGDMFNFIQKIEGVEFSDALEQLAEKAGVKLQKSDYDEQGKIKRKVYFINNLTAKFYHYLLTQHKIGKKALKYLKQERKLTDPTIKEFNIGYAPDSWDILQKFLIKKGVKKADMILAGVITKSRVDYIDKFRGRVVFPLTGIDGKTQGFTGRTVIDRDPKYLNTSETPVFFKTNFLFGLDKGKLSVKKEGAIFVEGQLDVISAHQHGISNVVAVSGTALTANQLKILKRYTKDITFCYDSDEAGVNAIYRAIELAEKQNFNITVAIIPDKYKDLDELIINDTTKAREMLKETVPAYDFFIITALKRYDKHSAMGKKQIMDELLPLFSKISNKVLFDHYSKQIASELDLSSETVFSTLKRGEFMLPKQEEYSTGPEEDPFVKPDAESYLICLLLKANLDTSQKHVYKLGPKSFLNPNIRDIFVELKEHIKDRKRAVNIKAFTNKLEENLQSLTTELYLWDIGTGIDMEDDDKMDKEIEETVKRVKRASAKKELKELTEELKLAEAEKNSKLVAKLTDKVNKISKSLM